MEELIQTIPKNSNLESSQDYDLLRNKGIEHIQKLGNKLWTDYNPHDPGITLLELLSYAITDLGYRTGFDMKDLLAPENGDLSVFEETFHKAAKIFPCNQVTVTDIRKLLIDIDGIRNAWVRVSDSFEDTYFVDFNNSLLMETMPGPNIISTEVKSLKGLYDIVIEFDRNIVRKGDATKENEVWKQAKREVHKHRNLCEDFYSEGLIVKKPDGCEEIKIYADIDVLPNSDNEAIFAEVLVRLERFFSPSVTFYSMQELFEKGLRSDQIFEGPLLKHGFVSDEELEAVQKIDVIHTSDLYNILMDIEGVIAVRNLQIENFVNMSCLNPGTPVSQGDPQKWCLELYNKVNPSTPLDLDLVLKATLPTDIDQVRFYKGDKDIPVTIDPALVFSKLEVLRFSDMKKRERLENEVFDLEIPLGDFRELNDYYPVQNELPMTYGTGEEGLADNVSDERKAQAKQLKAYLLFFEQLLANYLSQLHHVRELFSWNDQTDRTYFSQVVQGIKDISDLYVQNYVDEEGNTINLVVGDVLQENTLAEVIQKDAESPEVFFDRRNRFLNHLIARFNEVFTEYSLMMSGIGKADDIIPDKAHFLNDYDIISHGRGKGFDLKKIQLVSGSDGDDYKPEVWDTLENVSGYEFRVKRFLGIENASRRFLYSGHTFSIESKMTSPTVQQYYFKMLIDFNGTEIVLTGKLQPTDDMAYSAFNSMLTASQTLTYTNAGTGPYRFEIYNGVTLMATSQDFATPPLRNDARDFVDMEYFDPANVDITTGYLLNGEDGLHVIEHILLRPKTTDYNYLSVSTEPTDTYLTAQYENMAAEFDTLDPAYGNLLTGSQGLSLYELPLNAPRILIYNVISQEPLNTIYANLKIFATEFSRYELKSDGPVTAPYYFYVHDFNNSQYGESIRFALEADRDTALLKMLAFFASENGDSLGACSSTVDPYSYRATVVLPSWTERAKVYSYRALAEKIIRLEAPAHVSLDIFWIDQVQMRELEICYRKFLLETAKGDPNQVELPADPAALVARANCTMDKISNLQDTYSAVYDVKLAKNEEYFRDTLPSVAGHLLADVTDPQNAEIVKAEIIGGDPLPVFIAIHGDNASNSITANYNLPGPFNIGDIVIVSSNPDPITFPEDLSGVYPGTWTVTVETINEFDQVSCSEVTITIIQDIDAVWTIEPPKHQNCYDTFDLLASVYDSNEDIYSAELVSPFVLPPGVALQEGAGFIPGYSGNVGDIVVVNPALLKAAVDAAMSDLTYIFKVKTVELSEGNTVAEIKLVIKFDISLTVDTSFNCQHIDQYSDTDSDPHPNSTDIVQITDTDGIDSITVLTPSLVNPSLAFLNSKGIDLFIEGPLSSHGDPIHAYFRVVNHAVLKAFIDNPASPNTFPVILQITDGCGYQENIQVDLCIKRDTEAVATVIPVQHVNNFNNGETVVTITDVDNGIVEVLPQPSMSVLTNAGLQLVYSGGAAYIKVQNQYQFEQTAIGGTFTPVTINSRAAYRYNFTVHTKDGFGGTSVLNITIDAYKDREAEYVFAFPSGTSILAYLNFPVHENNNNNVLKKAPFNDFKVKSFDFLPAGEAGDFVKLGAPVLFDSNNPIVANVYDADGPIVNAVELIDSLSMAPGGAFYKLGNDTTTVAYPVAPAYATPLSQWGALLNPVTGTICIGMNSTVMAKAFNEHGVGTHYHRIQTTDIEGGITVHDLVIVISKDLPAIYKAQGAYPRSYDKYAPGEIIKYAEDPNGRIVSATVKSGTIPPGTEFDTKTGEIRVLPAVSVAPVVISDSVSFTVGDTSGVVSVPLDGDAIAFKTSGPITSEVKSTAATSLVAGTWNFTVKTVDEFGGVTDNIPVSITLNAKAVVGTKKYFTDTAVVLGTMEGKYSTVLAKKTSGEGLYSSPSGGLGGLVGGGGIGGK